MFILNHVVAEKLEKNKMISKEREIDKDTVVAYHTRVQNQIKNELNGLNLGPGRFPIFLAGIFYVGGLVLGVIGVLVITLRHRHVYLISWNDQFLGPAFISLFILCVGFGTYMVVLANRRSNEYRRGLVVRKLICCKIKYYMYLGYP